ncbi:MAG: translocation/assembly module TamB domain-containing protein, partial [Kofleriaceae bacterium]
EETAEPIDIAGLDVFAHLHIAPITGELSAIATLRGHWTQRDAPIAGLASVIVGDDISIPVASIDAAGANVLVANGRVNSPAGVIIASASPKNVAQLAPGVVLPSRMWVAIDASTTDSLSRANLVGAMGRSRLHGRVVGSIDKMTANAVIAVTHVDLALVSKGAATGRADALVGVVAGRDGLRGTVIAKTGQVVAPKVHRKRKKRDVPVDETPLSVPAINALIAFDALPDRASGLVLATAAGRAGVAIVGTAHAEGPPDAQTMVIDAAHIGANVPDLFVASGGLVPVRGSLDLGADASGRIGEDLAVDGWFVGRRLRVEKLAIADARGEFSTRFGKGLSGTATATALGIVNAGTPIGKATVAARTRDDGRIGVIVDATPAMAPVFAHVESVVSLPTPDGVIDIDIESHRVQLPNGTWAGRGGNVRIEKTQIAVKDFRSQSGDARLAVSVNAGRGNGVITGKVKLTDGALDRMSKEFRGSFDIDLAIEKRGIRWKGGGTVAARGVALSPDALPIDGNLELSVDGRRVKVAVRASNPSIGGGRVSLEVDGPRDLTDVDAWKRVARSDLHGVTVGLDSLQGSAISGGALAGVFDGTIEIRQGVPDGKLRVRGIPTPLGTAGADVSVALDDLGFLDVTGTGSVGNAGEVTFGARIQIPDRPFDVEIYKRVGKNLVHSASVATSDIEINPDITAKLGIIQPYSGIVVAKVDVGTGGSSIDVGIDVKGVTGGPLRAPLDVHAGARVDGKETSADFKVSARQGTLLELTGARTPVSLDQWIALAAKKPFALPNAPIAATLVIPTIDAKQTLAMVGRRDVVGGTLAGQIVAGGTLLAPTATGTIDLANIAVRPRLTGKPPAMLKSLHVAAAWAADKAELRITGEESQEPFVPTRNKKTPPPPPTLLVEASTDPRKLAGLVGVVKIENFDLTPIAVFLPGMLVGAQGKIDADIKIAGLGPTGKARGYVAMEDMRLPFSPLFSPLRRGTLRVDFADTGAMALELRGVIGASKSTVEVTAHADPTATDTTLKVKIVELTPIGFLQPKISANVRGTIHRKGLFWSGELEVTQGLVFIPEQRGNDLLEDYTPPDLIFVGEEEIDLESTRLRPPTKPFLVLDVNIRTTRIELPSFVIPAIINVPIIERAKATAAGRVKIAVGDTIGMDGEILIDRGETEILGRKYDVELGQIGFDGTIDPIFDLKLSHEFEQEGVTTYVRFAGRLSEIDTLEPEFTSDPGTYSQSSLFGFFLGGTPGADTGDQGQDALSAAGQAAASSIASAFVRRKLTRNRLDVLRCDPETSTTGRSCIAGKYFGKRDQLFFGGVVHLAPRQDENQTELRLEYRFRNGIQFELSGGDRGIFGGDFLRRRRF